MASKPQSPPASPPTPKQSNANKELERKLKEAKARKKEAEKDLARGKEQLAKTNEALKTTEGDVEQLEKDLAVQERSLRERDRSLHYITELLSSSHGRMGGNEILTSVFGKLARLGSGKKKAKKTSTEGVDKKGSGTHQQTEEEENRKNDSREEEEEKRSNEGGKKNKKMQGSKKKKKKSASGSTAGSEAPVVLSSPPLPSDASPSLETTSQESKNENEEVESGAEDYYDDGGENEEYYEDDYDDDNGFFIFDMRSKVHCEKGPRGVCVWEEFNHLSANLRYFRDVRAQEVAELFDRETTTGVVMESLVRTLQHKTRAPLPLLLNVVKYAEKAVGKPNAFPCLLIGLIAVSQSSTNAEKETQLFDVMTRGTEGRLSLAGARDLFRYRLLFVQAVVRASPPGSLDEKELKRGLQKLFGKHTHPDDPKAVWNRAAASVFQFVRKQRERERRTLIDDDDNGEEKQQKNESESEGDEKVKKKEKKEGEGEVEEVTRREWVDAMKYFAHYFHADAPRLYRGEGSDEIGEAAEVGESADEQAAKKEKRKKKKRKEEEKQSPAGESGESGVGDCADTDNEEHYLSDYEISEDEEEEEPDKDEEASGRRSGRKASWEVEHVHDLATFIGSLNAYLRPAAGSCRAVLPSQTLCV